LSFFKNSTNVNNIKNDTIIEMNAIIFGAGNIGSVLTEKLIQEGVNIKYIVRTSGIFDINSNQVGNQSEWKKYVDEVDVAFICIPTVEAGEQALEYEKAFLEKNKPVITCEKSSIAHYWNDLNKYKNIFKYSASVGGGTMMLKEISKYQPTDIKEIKGVVNGTLNYISDELNSGKTKDEVVKEVIEEGYAEPSTSSFEEIISAEMRDVILKTIIIANHSGIFDGVITKQDIKVVDFDEKKRCVICINKDSIEVGFTDNNNSNWLPGGVNNVLYINGEKKVEGPGAGAEATVLSMISDYREL
jgi:homoserine dehydrogenase